jgi:NAD(P)-dependent dehydrogenase (short-subunit alcohol dehydrogenase family)
MAKKVSNNVIKASGRLAGKVAWVSGATSGIGLGIARFFAEEGALVGVASNDTDGCAKVAEDLIRQGGGAVSVPCDVSHEEQVKRSIDATVKAFGRLDILINNAGIVDIRQLHLSSEADWDRTLDVNLKSIFFAFKHAYPHLLKNQTSTIVNMGSISSFVGQAGTPSYTTSKHAIMGLTRSIALDYGKDGIRCNCVCPGITDTPLLRHHLNATPDPDATLAERLKRTAMGVPLSPRDVAKTVLYLASDDSFGVTGTSVIIDAGYLAAAEWNAGGQTRFQKK